MGMSASQARLLSITSRLTNNEFRAQTITNSKLRLAEKSQEASQEYMDALNSQKLMYGVYDSDGEYTTQSLTPAILYSYAPLKNQYSLVNPAGKVLVSNEDAKNFENSDSLYDFLEKYKLVDISVAYEKYVEDKEKYNEDYAQYEQDLAAWNTVNDAYQEYQNQEDLYSMFSGVVGTSTNVQNTGAQGHYYRVLNEGNADCYLHVLNVLIDYNGTDLSNGTFVTSLNGTNVILDGADGGMSASMTAEEREKFSKISSLLDERYCDGDDDINTTGTQNLLEIAREEGRTPSDFEILRSDYKEIENEDGSYSYEKKTLQQKIVDLYYIIKNKSSFASISADVMREMLVNFTEGDMKKLSIDPPGDMPTPPIEPQKPSYNISLIDKEKAQWYTNLWHMMNGSETANKVNTETITYDGVSETVHTVPDCYKNTSQNAYEIFEDTNLFNNSEWLQFALEHGIVTLCQAQYDNPAENSGKAAELSSEGVTWKSIIYTNASDITSQEDEVAIAIAEVKYKNRITEIENEDKKFDQDLKKLDTEHTALQTEYDSIKEVISKNVERSFKAFS